MNCWNSIKKISLNNLRDRKIVIDANNYVYRFLSEDALIENFYLMISVFRKYNITPIFIFDGKVPPEKEDLIKFRKENKESAKKEYEKLEYKLKQTEKSEEYQEIYNAMNALKKKFLCLKKNDIKLVKMLLKSYGVNYFDAEGEADILCAKLVVKKHVYACMSEDMDMFVYGCPRVLRYVSFINCTAVLYDFKSILNELNLTKQEFKEICVISGTDYNYGREKYTSLYKTLKLFKKYKKNLTTENLLDSKLDFYDWLEKNTNYIEDYCKLCNNIYMFDFRECIITKPLLKIIRMDPINYELLHLIMEKEGFIFMN